MRCVKGTSGGAWVGVVQALAGCGESCGLHVHVLFGGSCAIPTRWAGQSFPKLRECNLRIQGIGWVGVSGNCPLTKMGNRLYYVEVAESLNFLSVAVSPLVNNHANDSAECIQPVTTRHILGE